MNAINKKQDIICVDNERHTYAKRQSLSKQSRQLIVPLSYHRSIVPPLRDVRWLPLVLIKTKAILLPYCRRLPSACCIVCKFVLVNNIAEIVLSHMTLNNNKFINLIYMKSQCLCLIK